MSDVRIPLPVRRVLGDAVDAAKLARVWKGVVAVQRKRASPSRRPWIQALATVLFATSLTWFFVKMPRGAPLRLANGHDVPANMVGGANTRLSFDDGSILEATDGTTLDLLESSERSFVMAMRAGRISFDVRPGGPRAWRVDCGPVVVEVVGTRFSVERSKDLVRVSVSRGAVLVRGEPVPDHVVRLGPGHAIVVPLGSSTARSAPLKPTSGVGENAPTPSAPESTRSAPSRPVGSPAATASTELAPPATPSVAGFEAPSAAPSRQLSPIDEGLRAFDTLRREGRLADAAAVLERVLREPGVGPGAAVAEFSLGRMYLESMGNPGLARAHFEHALAGGLPSALEEDAEARVVQASARAGDLVGAAAAANRYRKRHPNGRSLVDVDRWARGAQ